MVPLNQSEVLIANAADKFDAEGRLIDDAARDLIRDLRAALAKCT